MDILLDVIEQEFDFIGQLFVEFEQMMSYARFFDTADNRRSLATLFYDFSERLHQIAAAALSGKNLKENKGVSPVFPEGLFCTETEEKLAVFFNFYEKFINCYPYEIAYPELKKLAVLFPEIVEMAAADLRRFLKNNGR
ncbi:MAG: hypothetical protein WAN36_03395 [Calditrichia bacterium]